MLFGWPGNILSRDDIVLVWGGSGGLGCQAIQLARNVGARAVAVVSSDERGEYCQSLGAEGYINRKQFNHWGLAPHWEDAVGQAEWTKGARAFGKALWDVRGDRAHLDVVCEQGGMVVICAGSSGYSAMVDLRHVWVRQKSFQGSHGSNDKR